MPIQLFDKFTDLRSKLTIYPLLWFAIGLLLTMGMTVIIIRMYLDNYLMTQVVAYTQQTAKDISNIIDHDKEVISAFLLSDTMRDLENETRLTVALERLLSCNKNFLEGYVVDTRGHTRVGVSRLRVFAAAKPDFHAFSIYQKAVRGEIAISGWNNFIEANKPYWYMAVPIEKYPGSVIGVFIITIDLRRIEDVILTSQGAKYGNPVLIDHQGKILVHLDRSKIGNAWGNPKIIRKVIRGEIGTTNFHDAKGRYVLAAYQPIEPYNWGLIVQVPPGQTVYVIRDKVILLFGLMIFVIFIVTGTLTYMAAGKIVFPIKKLTQASRKFGLGEQPEFISVGGRDEIAQLSAAFCEMATSIQEHEKQRAQYISMIAHELRNPLTSLTGFMQSMQENMPFQDERLRNQGIIKLEQVNRMIGDLLEFSRLDLGQITFNPEIISIKYLCEDVISGYHQQSHFFIIEPFRDTICAFADPIRVQQIFQNIFDNSLKYTPPGCGISINCKETEDCVKINISDNGPGMSDEVLRSLFKPFQKSPEQKAGSYGLGLAIAKKLARGMNGDLTVESVEGRGTLFQIKLPGIETR